MVEMVGEGMVGTEGSKRRMRGTENGMRRVRDSESGVETLVQWVGEEGWEIAGFWREEWVWE